MPRTADEFVTCPRQLAKAMTRKLRDNAYKGGRQKWRAMSRPELIQLLTGEVRELADAVVQHDAEDSREHALAVLSEAADVANYAMELADRCGGLFLTLPARPKVPA